LKIHHISGCELSPDSAARWAALQGSDPIFESAFFHPEFMRAVTHVKSNVELGIIEDGGRALGFFPFERVSRRLGAPVGGCLSDYHGIISDRELDPGFDPVDLLRACRLDCWDFDHLPVAQSLIPSDPRRRIESPRIDLSEGFSAYARRKCADGSQVIDRAKYMERRLTREVGPIRFVAQESDRSVLDRLLRWKSAQYMRTGQFDIFRSAVTRNLLETLHHIETVGFSGTLSALYAGDRLIAAHFGLRSRDCWHYWFPAYDVAFSRYSPGQILILKMAAGAHALGVRSIDLGAGVQPYKLRLATHSTFLSAGSLQQASWFSLTRNVRRCLVDLAREAPFAESGRALLQRARAVAR
jgi:CelD/BcsL family acetyltransferase involved in cellulose biosynthesis